MILRLRGGREVSCDLDVFQNRTGKNARMNSREDGVHERASWASEVDGNGHGVLHRRPVGPRRYEPRHLRLGRGAKPFRKLQVFEQMFASFLCLPSLICSNCSKLDANFRFKF